MTTLAGSLWAPLPLWREDDPEMFAFGSLAYRTAVGRLMHQAHVIESSRKIPRLAEALARRGIVPFT
ncbi:hypothetical protein ACIBQ1_03335 [Nonomuraea sp. NPDC050153]|uniref:hypothetical protein n=1 Tax=Nonomuraea sp. NPDC050153 TaxID=3364359 RepID=UPI0037960376